MSIMLDNKYFAIVKINMRSSWDNIYKLCQGFLLRKDTAALADYFNKIPLNILVEKDYIDKDYRDTYSNFYSKKFAKYPCHTFRLHFFNCDIISLYTLEKHINNYLGYTVIRPTRINSIGRTILDIEKLKIATGMMCLTEYKTHIMGIEFKIMGFPYMSQDTEVNVCAHTSCWMVFRYLSERYPVYKEMYPHQISQLTNEYLFGRTIPSKGLTISQVAELFTGFGLFPEVYMRELTGDALFEQLLYSYIESGLPIVAGLEKKKHAITLFGHTINSSKIKGVISSPLNTSQFIDGYIVNDDNCLPYQTVSRKRKSISGYCSHLKVEDIDSIVVPLYEKIYLTAEYVQTLAIEIIMDRHFGFKNYSAKIHRNDIILRVFLTSSKSYKKYRKSNPIPQGVSNEYLQTPMSKFIWLCEISTIQEYMNKKIIGELIFDATSSQHDMFSFITIHYPEILIMNNRNEVKENSPTRLTIKKLVKKSNILYNCYISNLKEVN